MVTIKMINIDAQMHYSVTVNERMVLKCYNSNVWFVFHRCPPEWNGEYCQTNIYTVVAFSSTVYLFL